MEQLHRVTPSGLGPLQNPPSRGIPNVVNSSRLSPHVGSGGVVGAALMLTIMSTYIGDWP